jgi:ribonuclease VapC
VIVIDSSALIAILEHEPEREGFFEIIASAERRLVSAVTYQETGQVVFSRRGQRGLDYLDDLLAAIRAEIVAYDAAMARRAITAFAAFGKGLHPKARLNFCDCSSYALAKSLDAPLLYKGNDFAATDIYAAL